MNTKHTPEPWNWTTGDNEVYVRQGGLILAKMRKDYTPKENAARIVACVNALAGKPHPETWVSEAQSILKQIGEFNHCDMKLGKSKIEELIRFSNERDELLSALKEAVEYVSYSEKDKYNSIIAKFTTSHP